MTFNVDISFFWPDWTCYDLHGFGYPAKIFDTLIM
jgi:hypothetical protein